MEEDKPSREESVASRVDWQSPGFLTSELLIGLTVAVSVLPQAIAFSTTLAGLPTYFGIYAAVWGVLITALLNSSRVFLGGPNSTLSAVIGVTLLPLVPQFGAAYLNYALMLVLMAGLIQMIFVLIKPLARLFDLMSEAVINGMICGIGLFLIMKSITAFGGLPINTQVEWPLMIAWQSLIAVIEIGNLYALQIGILALVTMLGVSLIRPLRNWAILLGIVVGTAYSELMISRHGLETVLVEQAADMSLIGFVLPSVPAVTRGAIADIISIVPGALTIALLGLMQTVSALRRSNQIAGQQVSSSEAIAADSVGNISLAFLSSMPTCASFNRIWLMHGLGARSRLVAVSSAVFLMLFVLLFPDWISTIPIPALAAVIILVGARMINWNEVRQHFSNRYEAVIFCAAFLAVPVFGLFGAVVLGSFLALIHFNWKKLHPDIVVEDGVIKIKGSLYYGSLPYVQRRVKDAVDNQGGKLTLDLRNASYDDAEAERWLREVQAKGASKVIGSTEQIGAFIPQSLNEDRRKELLDSARFFELKAGESSILLADSENDCLRVISGRVTVHGPSGEIFSLEPSRDRGCPCSFAKKGASLQIEANEDSLLCQLNQDEVDFLVGWQELSRAFGRQDSELERRMEKIRASLIFRQLPVEAIEEALKRMKTEEVKSGQDVVRQWEVGETFYVIDEGTAEVWREEFHGDDPECVAVLTAGDSFGEEALLTGKERGATVRMTSDGRLLVLAKSDFVRLVSRPMIREEAPETAKAMLTDGYKLLDVRYEEEWYESRIPNAILIPLPDLRNQMDELSQSSRYLVYCRSGKRSAVAAFLMTQRGIEAVSLKGGILEWPYEKESSIPEKKQKTDE